jgi:hypothetical protein
MPLAGAQEHVDVAAQIPDDLGETLTTTGNYGEEFWTLTVRRSGRSAGRT